MNLTDFVKAVSQEDFGKSFNHVAVWNTKLRSSGGHFFPADGHLDFNPKIYDTFGLDVFRKIVRHELCHYHLYFAGKGYKHADADFKDLLKAVDGLRYAPSSHKMLLPTITAANNVDKTTTESAVSTPKNTAAAVVKASCL